MRQLYTIVLLLTVTFVNAQSTLTINPNIVLPEDSVESKSLVNALNDFLAAAQKPNEENKLVIESEKIETFVLLDEINGIEGSSKFKDAHFYKPYLQNVVPLEDNKYLLQLSYIGINEGKALLRASFEIIAHKTKGTFLFSSPLLMNTTNWKTEKAGDNTFHYQNTINKEKIKELTKLESLYDQKLKPTTKLATDYYCCNNLIELQKLVGVQYKADYNGRTESAWSSSYKDRKLVVLGDSNANFNHFDPHDLFHDRLSLVVPRNKLNKPVDEGCAYLYGGSWGLTWEDIFKAFKEQIASNKTINWAEIKENPVYFKTKGFSNSADYIVNALLVKKIEKEKGFAGVWELLNVGPFENGNEKYYQTLEKLTGISKANYNEKIWELINNEK